jgi:hypothetical protein
MQYQIAVDQTLPSSPVLPPPLFWTESSESSVYVPKRSHISDGSQMPATSYLDLVYSASAMYRDALYYLLRLEYIELARLGAFVVKHLPVIFEKAS